MINWNAWLPTIVVIIGVIFGGGWWYYELYEKPDLTYQILPPYRYSEDESVTGILLKNVGHDTAHGVRLEINSPYQFIEIIIDSPEEWEKKKEWENATEAIFYFQRITNGVDITIYTSTRAILPQIDVIITSEEGMGHEETPEEGFQSMVLIAFGVIVVSLAALSFSFGFYKTTIRARATILEARLKHLQAILNRLEGEKKRKKSKRR